MSKLLPNRPLHRRSNTHGNSTAPTFKSLRNFMYCCSKQKTQVPRKVNSDRTNTYVSKNGHRRHSSLYDDVIWRVEAEEEEVNFTKPGLVKEYTLNPNASIHAISRHLDSECYIPKHLEPVTVGCLPPSELKIYGGESTDGPMVEVDRNYQDQFDFLYDSEVGTKFRGTTYYKPKKWTKKDDLLLISLQGKYKNNWKKISDKLALKSTRKDDTKSDLDCCRRWHMINKLHTQENEPESVVTYMNIDFSDNNTSTKCTLVRQTEFIWDEENNDKLLHLVATRGNNWKLFEKHFQGCSKYQIKQQYLKLKKEGRYPTGFEKQITQAGKRHRIKGTLAKMPTIMETSNEDLDEMKVDDASVSIKLSIKETVIQGSFHKSTSSSQKKFSKFLKGQCCSDCGSNISFVSDTKINMIDTSNISENIYTRYSGKKPCKSCQRRRNTLVGALNQIFN